MLLLSGCGYRIAGRQLNNGRGLTIAVPTFNNRTTAYRIEQRLTEAVRRELIRRTQFTVHPRETGDVVVTGEIASINLTPIILNQQGRGSSFSVIVDVKISVVDTRTGTILVQDNHTAREVFELAQNAPEYVPEDTFAMDRLAQRFASSLVASILHAKP